MKKTLLLLVMAVMAICASAQSPVNELATPEQMMSRHADASATSALNAPAKIDPDYDIIYDQPEGELRRYKRYGQSYVEDFYGNRGREDQDGKTINIVFDYDNGMAYLQDPVSGLSNKTWAKAYIEGDQLRVPMFQVLQYDDYMGFGYMLCHLGVIGGTVIVDGETEDMYYTMQEDGSITLDGTDNCSAMLGLVYTNNYEWLGFGDFESVYLPFEDEPLAIPENLTQESWMFSYSNKGAVTNRLVTVATDYENNLVYVAGIHPAMSDHAVVGTIGADDVVTFAADQFLGEYMGYSLYLGMCTHENEKFVRMPNCKMQLNREARILESADGVSMFQNAGRTTEIIYYWSYMDNPRFAYFNNEPATPVNPEILDFKDTYSEFGYNSIYFDIKLLSTEGEVLSPDLVKYIVWVKVEGEPEPFAFYPDEYYSLSIDGIDELVEVPYSFYCYARQGYTEIYPGGKIVYIYQIGFDDYGVQTIYYGGDTRSTSDIVWLGYKVDGLDTVLAPTNSAAASYDLQGRRIGAQQQGLSIRKGADGHSVKVIR